MSLKAQLQEKVEQLNKREKIMVFFAGLILFPGMIDFLVLQPMRDSATKWQQQATMINQRISSANQQQKELAQQIASDPAMELERRIEGTEIAIDSAEQELLAYTGSLIAPDKMAAMLKGLLQERGSLKLVSLENQPAKPLFDTKTSAKTAENQPSQKTDPGMDVFGLYRHGIKLVFKGQYMQSMDYIEALEALPWKFYWHAFDYQVEEYPEALVKLHIYTLSTNSYWIGETDEP
jgi:MSHA biogenesis protein MshJ